MDVVSLLTAVLQQQQHQQQQQQQAAREAAFPMLRVKEWLSTRSEVFVKLSRQFETFFADACLRVDVAPPAALYWFEGEMLIASRKKLLPDNYGDFVALCIAGKRPTVHVFKHGSPAPGHTTSPDESPAARVPLPEGHSAASGSSSARDPGKQEEFRLSLLRRDGRSCVLCHESRDARYLEAAHVVPQRSSGSVLSAHGLATSACPQNGVMLCGVCHEFFDRWMWYVTADGTVVVADALLHDEDGAFKSYWAKRNSRPLLQAADMTRTLWPPSSVWKFRELKFLEAQRSRWESAEKPHCSKCGRICKNHQGLAAHIDSGACQRAATLCRKVVHATPTMHRRSGGGVGVR